MGFWDIYAWLMDGPIYWVKQHCYEFLIALLVAYFLSRVVARIGNAMDSGLRRWGRRRGRALVLVFVLAIVVRLALLPLLPKPEPAIHDEFSYLLAADTFASGRLTNPTPALWPHFETFHVNLVPTYQSMYPPAQGLLLALGKWLTGEPWVAVVFSVGLACAAICWALQGWMPPGWALLGGLFAVLRYSGVYYWMNSYWGGAVPAIGGALVLGALPRILRRQRVRDALLFALGVVILANSRPYEGLLVLVPLSIALAVWLLRPHVPRRIALTRIVLPAALLLAGASAAMLYYDWRSTGHPFLMPYQVNQRQYHITQPFLWQSPRPLPRYRHAVMRDFYWKWEYSWWPSTRHLIGLRVFTWKKLDTYYWHFVWPFLLPLLIACWYLAKNPRQRVLPVTLLFVLAGVLLETWLPNPHYAAPAAALTLAMAILGLRYLRLWRRRTRLGLRWSQAAVPILMAVFLLQWQNALGLGSKSLLGYPWVYTLDTLTAFPEPGYNARCRLLHELERLPGKHLVIVRYGKWHDPLSEWVYNAADLEAARVVWAREMSPADNQRLLQHYRQRRIWLVEPDQPFPRLQPYAPPAGVLAGQPGFPESQLVEEKVGATR